MPLGLLMSDYTLLGPWIRRFLLEHIVAERNLARNTQHSYRDALAYSFHSWQDSKRRPLIVSPSSIFRQVSSVSFSRISSPSAAARSPPEISGSRLSESST